MLLNISNKQADPLLYDLHKIRKVNRSWQKKYIRTTFFLCRTMDMNVFVEYIFYM